MIALITTLKSEIRVRFNLMLNHSPVFTVALVNFPMSRIYQLNMRLYTEYGRFKVEKIQVGSELTEFNQESWPIGCLQRMC